MQSSHINFLPPFPFLVLNEVSILEVLLFNLNSGVIWFSSMLKEP